jgi:lipopolysaccharide export system protein LptA
MSPNGAISEFLKRGTPRVLSAIAAVLMLTFCSGSWAQETNSTATGGGGFGLGSDDKKPIEISAENGIEWKRDARTYTARGNALAQQGDTSIAADTLIAYLDERDEISHWEGIGNVRIRTSQSTSYGDHATYQESTRLLVLTGRDLKVVTESQTVTARDQIEYWRDKDVVVAKGAVVIMRPEKNTTIHSDEATAYFRDKVDDPATPEDETGNGSEVYQVEAQGHVRVDRKEQTAFSDHLAYNPDTEIAVLTGNVVIHSKDNTYKGGRAELDLKNDINRLLPAQGQRVHTVIKPKDEGNATDAGTKPAPVTQ